MSTITQTISTLPAAPDPATMTRDVFSAAAAASVLAQKAMVPEINTWAGQANALATSLNALAAGTAIGIPYTFSTTTTDSDPGAGVLRLDNATQNAATTIRADLSGSDASVWTDVLNTLDDSTSTIKGHVRLVKNGDATKWLIFTVSALASPSGYKNITVANVAFSAASPFTNADSIIFEFTRTGDKGEVGATGASGTGISPDTVGWHATAGTTPKTLTVDVNATMSNVVTRTSEYAGTTGGSTTAYTLTPSPAITAYADGQRFLFIAHAANTGSAPTFAISGLAGLPSTMGSVALPIGGLLINNKYCGMVEASGTSIRIAPYDALSSNGGTPMNGSLTFSSGTPIFTTPAQGTNSTAGATTAFVMNEFGKHKNILINGGFTINQIGYVSAATLASGVYGHDGWKAGSGGGDYSFTQLNSNTSITIASSKTLIQVVENKNVQHTAYVLSWAGTAQARYAVNSATPAGSYAASPIVISGQTAGTTMSIEFNAGTVGTVQLEPSAAATAFEYRTYAEELALCQRYYEKITIANGGTILGGGYIQNTSVARFTLPCAPKYSSPTLAYSGNLDIMYSVGTTSTVTAAAGVIYSANSSLVSFYFAPTGTPLIAGESAALYANGADAVITLSARL